MNIICAEKLYKMDFLKATTLLLYIPSIHKHILRNLSYSDLGYQKNSSKCLSKYTFEKLFSKDLFFGKKL